MTCVRTNYFKLILLIKESEFDVKLNVINLMLKQSHKKLIIFHEPFRANSAPSLDIP
jgi:hypothetical protein